MSAEGTVTVTRPTLEDCDEKANLYTPMRSIACPNCEETSPAWRLPDLWTVEAFSVRCPWCDEGFTVEFSDES